MELLAKIDAGLMGTGTSADDKLVIYKFTLLKFLACKSIDNLQQPYGPRDYYHYMVVIRAPQKLGINSKTYNIIKELNGK
jgi:hypothetical protein